MNVGDLVRHRPPIDGQCIQIVGIVTKVTRFSVFVCWSNQAGDTSYNKNSVGSILEVINAKEIDG